MYDSTPLTKKDGSPVIGLALGSGAARGWAHIGVVQALAQHGIRPDVVCGCSIGALAHCFVMVSDWSDVNVV